MKIINNIIIVLLIITLFFIRVNNAQKINNSKSFYNVGDSFDYNGFNILYVSSNSDYNIDNITLSNNEKVVEYRLLFENKSNSNNKISTDIFNCYVGDLYSKTIVDTNKSYNLSPGKKVIISIYCIVPNDTREVLLEYYSNYFVLH